MPAQEKVSVLVVDDTADSREMILRMLQFDPAIEVVGTARTGLEAIEQAQKLKPDVVVMDINMPDMDGIEATEHIRRKIPFTQIVILSVQNDTNYMRRAMLAGARDFLTKPPLIDELTAAIQRAGVMAKDERSKTAMVFTGPTGVTGPLMARYPIVQGASITVYSPKGGTGCTTVATNLAVALKENENRVLLIDSNLLYGDVAIFLNEHGKNTILELIERAEELDPEIIQDVIIKHPSTGLHLLPAPNQPEVLDADVAEKFGKLIEYLKQLYNYIVIDTCSFLTDVVQSALDLSDVIVLVTTQAIPAIKSANQFLSLADASGIGRKRIVFVLNQYDKRISISPERVSESLHQTVDVAIPLEERIIASSVNRGVPFMVENKNIPAGKGITQLAEKIRERVSQENGNK